MFTAEALQADILETERYTRYTVATLRWDRIAGVDWAAGRREYERRWGQQKSTAHHHK